MTGRRTRNMQDKQQRIFAAASSLFDAHGFEPVTVAQIAEAADVAAGTLFRYASSKAELLLMVYNDQFRQAIETGMRNAADIDDPSAAVFAMVAPVITEAARQPDNATAYQRELLFGSPTERFRAEASTTSNASKMRSPRACCAAARPIRPPTPSCRPTRTAPPEVSSRPCISWWPNPLPA